MTTHDPVNHPKHYHKGRYETIKVIDAWGLNFNLGNAVKYISRAGNKGSPLEDLRKARWYLNHELRRIRAKARIRNPRPPRQEGDRDSNAQSPDTSHESGRDNPAHGDGTTARSGT